jgi:hypothetical protein
MSRYAWIAVGVLAFVIFVVLFAPGNGLEEKAVRQIANQEANAAVRKQLPQVAETVAKLATKVEADVDGVRKRQAKLEETVDQWDLDEKKKIIRFGGRKLTVVTPDDLAAAKPPDPPPPVKPVPPDPKKDPPAPVAPAPPPMPPPGGVQVRIDAHLTPADVRDVTSALKDGATAVKDLATSAKKLTEWRVPSLLPGKGVKVETPKWLEDLRRWWERQPEARIKQRRPAVAQRKGKAKADQGQLFMRERFAVLPPLEPMWWYNYEFRHDAWGRLYLWDRLLTWHPRYGWYGYERRR